MRIDELAERGFADRAPLWQGYLTFYKADLHEATTSLTFVRLINLAEPMGGFIARDETGAARGIVHWIDYRSCWTPGDYCYLQYLFVVDSVRPKPIIQIAGPSDHGLKPSSAWNRHRL